MSTTSTLDIQKKSRIIAYVDGFNVYYGLRHACRDADHNHLKYGGSPNDCLGRSLYWLDLESVVLGQLKRSEHCVAIKYFSAPRKVPCRVEVEDKHKYVSSNSRQMTYLDALRTKPSIEIILGWYSENQPHHCTRCQHEWPNFEEKVTDVNIATHLLKDAYEDRFDTAFVISADADLVPPVNAVAELDKRVVLGLFPGRKRAKHLRQAASENRGMKIRYLRDKRLPPTIERGGLPPLTCPEAWHQHQGWVWNAPAPIPSANTPAQR